MNDIYFAENNDAFGSSLKNLVWSAASSLALHGLCTWRLQENWFRLEQRDMPLPGLGAAWDGARLVHLSDLHASPLMRARHLLRYVELVNRLAPDFVVITGDFITASARSYARSIADILGQLRPRVASLGCLGNHDYGIWRPKTHAGVPGLAEYVSAQLTAAGVTPLISRSRTFRRRGADLHFVGLGDLWTPTYDPVQAFADVPSDGPVVALVHNPDAAWDLARCGARYVLAGHTHGKPTPDTRLNNLLFPVENRNFVAGEYPLGPQRRIYVNRGVGHSRRSAAEDRPEITLFTLRDVPLATRRSRRGSHRRAPVAAV